MGGVGPGAAAAAQQGAGGVAVATYDQAWSGGGDPLGHVWEGAGGEVPGGGGMQEHGMGPAQHQPPAPSAALLARAQRGMGSAGEVIGGLLGGQTAVLNCGSGSSSGRGAQQLFPTASGSHGTAAAAGGGDYAGGAAGAWRPPPVTTTTITHTSTTIIHSCSGLHQRTSSPGTSQQQSQLGLGGMSSMGSMGGYGLGLSGMGSMSGAGTRGSTSNMGLGGGLGLGLSLGLGTQQQHPLTMWPGSRTASPAPGAAHSGSQSGTGVQSTAQPLSPNLSPGMGGMGLTGQHNASSLGLGGGASSNTLGGFSLFGGMHHSASMFGASMYRDKEAQVENINSMSGMGGPAGPITSPSVSGHGSLFPSSSALLAGSGGWLLGRT